jgi:Icc-related predicted phosphoesterase
MAKLKIDLISDVHLEFGDLPIENRNQADVLIMAGDICVAQDLHDHPEDNPAVVDTGTRAQAAQTYRAFFRRVCEQYPNVIYVMGNHEHYHGKVDQSRDIFNTEFERMGLPIRLLERETCEINGVTFIGSTLWTDFNRSNPISMYECQTMMNDYRIIRIAKDNYRRLRPQDTLDEHYKNKNYILEKLSSTRGPVVVVGHHAPTEQSVKPHYENDFHLNGAYRSDLTEIMMNNPRIRLWVHGHTHSEFLYQVNETIVACNPRGYVNYERGSHEVEPYYPTTLEVETDYE